jgi:glycosyltransferase involved in cell wall biosynthesis
MEAAPRLPTISVVMYVLNAGETIERALGSVTGPDQPPVELLVMDGGSTDRTLDLIRQYEAKIAFWRSRRDGSAIVALNEGVEKATGDIICLLPADDWIEPGALHAVRDYFARNPDVDVLSCGTRFVHFDADGELRVDREFIDPRRLRLAIGNIVKCPLTAGHFITRRMYQKLGGYNELYDMSNDLDFLIRVCLQRPKTAEMPGLVYTYRMHPQSRTLSGNPRMVFQMMQENIRVAEHHLAESTMEIRERKELIGLHGRNSARFAWMLFRQGQYARAMGVLHKAFQLNKAWPLQVWYWSARRLLRAPGPA